MGSGPLFFCWQNAGIKVGQFEFAPEYPCRTTIASLPCDFISSQWIERGSQAGRHLKPVCCGDYCAIPTRYDRADRRAAEANKSRSNRAATEATRIRQTRSGCWPTHRPNQPVSCVDHTSGTHLFWPADSGFWEATDCGPSPAARKRLPPPPGVVSTLWERR
jgi:hypothetical protein